VGELADERVGSSAEGDGKDETNGEQLDGDLLEGADALGDGVRCKTLLVSATPWTRYDHGRNSPECSSFCNSVSM